MYDLIKAKRLHSNRAVTAYDNGWLVPLINIAQPAKVPHMSWSSDSK